MRALVLIAVIALIAPAAAQGARPGTLDKSFGGDGRVETRVPGGRPALAGVESVPGGKLLLAGTVGDRTVVLVRYRRDGQLDRSFGRGGVRSFAFDRNVTATATVLDAEGRLVVAGGLGPFGKPGRAALVLRFDRRGYLDSSFDQDGIAVVDFGGDRGDDATAIALTPEGSIVVAGSINSSAGGGLGVARLDAAGLVDGSFGDRGFVRMWPHFSFDSISASGAGVEPDGEIALAVTYGGPKGGAPFLVKLLRDGRPDPAFGGQYDLPGWRGLAGAEGSSVADLVLDPSTGRILLAGTSCPRECGLFSPWVTSAPGDAPWGGLIEADRRGAYGHMLALDPAGRATVVGAASFSAAPPEGRLFTRTYAYMLVARLNPAGKVDRCFGREGIARIWFPNKLSRPAGLAITPAGKIVIAGPEDWGETTPTKFQLARLHGGGCRRR